MSREIRATVHQPSKLPAAGETHFQVYLPGLHDLKHGDRIVVTIMEGK